MNSKKRVYYLITSLIIGLLFISFSFWVNKELFNSFDFDTTVKLQNRISRRFDMPFSLFSLLGSFEYSTILLVGIFVFLLLRKKKFFLGIFFYILIMVVELAGKIVVFHPGPPYMFFRYSLGFSFPSSYILTNYSYPSGHAARAAFLSILCIFLISQYIKSKHLRILFYGLVALELGLMSVSRVYLGEHWLTDVIGGLLLGSGFATLSLFAW